MNDYLDSRDTAAEMVKRATDVRTVYAKAGFEIRNWQPNSKQVLENLGEKLTAQRKDFTGNLVTHTWKDRHSRSVVE